MSVSTVTVLDSPLVSHFPFLFSRSQQSDELKDALESENEKTKLMEARTRIENAKYN